MQEKYQLDAGFLIFNLTFTLLSVGLYSIIFNIQYNYSINIHLTILNVGLDQVWVVPNTLKEQAPKL